MGYSAFFSISFPFVLWGDPKNPSDWYPNSPINWRIFLFGGLEGVEGMGYFFFFPGFPAGGFFSNSSFFFVFILCCFPPPVP